MTTQRVEPAEAPPAPAPAAPGPRPAKLRWGLAAAVAVACPLPFLGFAAGALAQGDGPYAVVFGAIALGLAIAPVGIGLDKGWAYGVGMWTTGLLAAFSAHTLATPTPDPLQVFFAWIYAVAFLAVAVGHPKRKPDPPRDGKGRVGEAVLLLIVLLPLPALGLAAAVQLRDAAWIAIAAAAALMFASPAAAIALRVSWAASLARYVGGMGLVGAIVRLLMTGPTVPTIAITVAYAAALAILNPPAPPKKKDETEEAAKKAKAADHVPAMIRDNVEAIAVAFVTALIIRCFCIEVFQIPSSSMEPTLMGGRTEIHPIDSCEFAPYHGGRPDGDRIMVTKYYYAFTEVARFDVVVFKFPLNQAKNFIKRVVGLPGDSLFISNGNLYVRRPGDPEGEYRIARKPLRVQQSVWMYPREPEGRERNHVLTRDAFNDTWASEVPPQAEKAAGHDHADGGPVVVRGTPSWFTCRRPPHQADDLRLAMDLRLEGEGTFRALIQNNYGRFELALPTSGPGTIEWKQRGGEKARAQLRRPFPVGRRARLEFMVYDGLAVVLINERVAGELDWMPRYDRALEGSGGRDVGFGAHGATFTLHALSLSRDIHYAARGHIGDGGPEDAVAIPEGSYLMMGDNVDSSHDSRAWELAAFKFKDGRPPVECEWQDVVTRSDEIRDAAEARGRPDDAKADFFVKADRRGYEHFIRWSDLDNNPDREKTHHPFVERKYIVGKALWIWWPPGRWFQLIR